MLAEILLARGLRVHVFDRKQAGNGSMAAAGVVNPVVLKRDVPSWRAAELLPLAIDHYTAMERRLGVCFWHPLELVKLFPTEREVLQWERAMLDPATSAMLDLRAQPSLDEAPLHAPHGHGTVLGSAWLDVQAMLDAQRTWLLAHDGLTEELLAPGMIEAAPDGVRIGNRSAPWLIHCTGAFASLGGLVPVKGEVLTVRLPGLHVDRMVHRGVFLLPVGDDLYRVGSTFAWDGVWGGPTEAARSWLLEKLGKLTSVKPEVVDQWSGVRPTTSDRRPILGRVGTHEAVMNGLGSRGVLQAPWCAQQLAAHLFDHAALDPEVCHDRPFAAR